MILPQNNNIYLYEGKKYIIRYCAMIDTNLVAQTIPENNEGSEFVNFNYWKFAMHAKHIGESKLGKAY